MALYYKTVNIRAYNFPKDDHEKELDEFVKEINKREKLIDSACKLTDYAVKMNSKDIVVGQKL